MNGEWKDFENFVDSLFDIFNLNFDGSPRKSTPPSSSTTSKSSCVLNWKESEFDNNYAITIGLPGLTKDDVEVTISKEGVVRINVLVDSQFVKKNKYESVLYKKDINLQDSSSRMENGVLTIILPKISKGEDTIKVKVE